MELVHTPDVETSIAAKEADRLAIAQHTAEFLKNGGVIEKVSNSSVLQEIQHVKQSLFITPAAKKKLIARLEKKIYRANSPVS